MSQQDPASEISSVETKVQAADTTSAADQHLPLDNSLQAQATQNLVQASNSTSIISEPKEIAPNVPRIPKLSPSTTELLARVSANIRGDIRDSSNTLGKNPVSHTPSPSSTSAENTDLNTRPGNMRVSSAFISLPTPPFPGPASQSTSSVSQKTTPLPQNIAPKVGLVAIAPKPQAPVATPLQPAPPVASSAPIQSAGVSTKKTQRATASPSQRRRVTNGAKGSKKRRRNHGSDEEVIKAGDSSSDESSDFAPVATQTKSGRQVTRPSLYVPPSTPAAVSKPKKESPHVVEGSVPQNSPVKKRRRVYRKGKEMNVNCIHCQRGHGPSTNMIVFCDECNRAWHQFCHDPPIEKDVITVKEAEWFCYQCRPTERPVDEIPTTTSPILQSQFESSSSLIPSLPPPTEVGGEQFSAAEKRAYLSSLSHAGLINLLMTVSDHNPSLPMFPLNLRDLPVSRLISSENSATALSTTAMAVSFPEAAVPAEHRDDDGSSESSEYEVEEHRLYPRAGNGFRIPMTPEDLDMLLDDPACPTFSYALHGPAKAKAEMAGIVTVSGSA
ncbi:PHD finger domain protein [Paecilomyces variotii No. 5]|uniref:PHD finger domain protein n=1 Tax=Byssochlamys spectabilis (strain No. 5 / NBRC 109023) TaxID=1356009 RepID=V5FCI0_BYSSN|nr:PHD finger domain protein [Paecilomyces variotii No. 5]